MTLAEVDLLVSRDLHDVDTTGALDRVKDARAHLVPIAGGADSLRVFREAQKARGR